MAYDAHNLSVLAYANGFTLWHYKTPDTLGAVDDCGYFDGAAPMLRTGDFIFTNANVDTIILQSGVFIVAANSSGSVDVALLTGQ